MTKFVFVDVRVQGFEALLGDADADAQVVLLDSHTDGIAQIVSALQGSTDLSAIHIISHGTAGTLYLGSTVLTVANLGNYQSELAQIGRALAPQGDLLLYGCDVAAGDAGQSFIQSLAQLTGADVAASTDPTGAAALGGNWVLEASSGAIEAPALAPMNFAALLAPPVVTPAGTLDTTFGTGGKVTTPVNSNAVANAIALQADGKIVVAGQCLVGVTQSLALARYNADGILDSTFSGDGIQTSPFGQNPAAASIVLQADGKIVVVGNSFVGASNDFALARYNPDGNLDSTFGVGGKLTTDFNGGSDQAFSAVLQGDKILVAGIASTSANGGTQYALARYTIDGAPDTTFGTNGKLFLGVPAGSVHVGMALQPDGKIVLAGSSNGDFWVARYSSNGTLETSFDGDGTTDFGNFAFDDAYRVALQADGKVVVAGTSGTDFALARYNTDGSRDDTFSDDGKLITPIGISSTTIQVTGVAVQADGRIVVLGYARDFQSGNGNVVSVLARYTANGFPDNAFDGDGLLTNVLGGSTGALNGLAVQTDGAIVTAGSQSNGFAVVRVVGSPGIPDVTAAENAPFHFTFKANTFTDPDGGTLTYTTNALPSWLHFDAANRTFSGPPGSDDVGSTVNVTVTATDTTALSASDTFSIAVQHNAPPALNFLLDQNFGLGGEVVTSSLMTNRALQADGHILTVQIDNIFSTVPRLVRFNSDGKLDTTFGTNGQAPLSIGFDSFFGNPLALQAGGKIVVVGSSLEHTTTGIDLALARYNANGSLDTTFGVNGTQTTDFGAGVDVVTSTTLQNDGKIVVAGYIFTNINNVVNSQPFLARYTATGFLDNTFHANGELLDVFGALGGQPASVALQADGKIVVAGNNGTDLVVARYNADGSADSTFSGGGITAIDFDVTDSSGLVAVQADGKIVVAGHTNDGNYTHYDFALARLNADGSLDTTFSGDGKLTTDIGGSTDYAQDIALQADGKIVVAGITSSNSGFDYAVVRYNPDGTLDTTFNGNGKFVLDVDGNNDLAASVDLQPNGSILVGGLTALFRLKPVAPDLFATEDTPFVSTVAANTFIDPDGGPVTYSASRADGSALPAWLSFDTVTRTFSGTPSNDDVGSLSIKLTAADNWNATSSTTFTLSVANINDAPVVAKPIPGTSASITSLFNYTIAADTFTDVDKGDVLTYSAAQHGGFVLPSWLHFDAATLTFYGTPPPEEGNHRYTIAVTAKDLANASAFTEFDLQVNGSYIPGTDGNDNLLGTREDDWIDGKAGADKMTGKEGNDTYIVDNPGDQVIELNGAAEGNDTVRASVTYSLLGSVENLILTGSGNIDGTGNNLFNQITGNSGNNRLDGGTGIDILNGGDGNDTYVVDNVQDQVNEAPGAGIDSVEASSVVPGDTFTLPANIENLTLMGSTAINAIGNELPNILTGNSGNNVITGGDGNDILIGGDGDDTLDGGLGADTMLGGLDNDTYIVDNPGDTVVENPDQGTDLVKSSITWTLGPNVENLVLTGTANIDGTGNTLSNTLTGNSGNNVLNGGGGTNPDTLDGGAGNDTLIGGDGNDILQGGTGVDAMQGGAGNDVYYVDTRFDNVIDSGGTTDEVVIAVNFTAEPQTFQLYAGIELVRVFDINAFVLVTGNELDNLIRGGNGDDVLDGAQGNDTLIGNAGNDTLEGGVGADHMEGGEGNDTYFVDNAGDVVVETDNGPSGPLAVIAGGTVNGGIDTVKDAIDYALTQFVENLTLIGISIKGTGNTLDNVITGNSFNNVLRGLEGNDTLTGGLGDDTLDGGPGIDIAVYTGAKANYTVTQSANGYTVTDSVAGRDGTDTLTGIETLGFSDGTQHLTSTLTSAVTTTLPSDTDNLTLTGNGNINGTGNALDNVITGNSGNNVLDGGAGNDTLTGGLGNDTLIAGDGDDIVICTHDDGVDTLSGGPGFDILDYSAVNGVVQINQLGGVATGSAGNDIIVDVFEQVIGTNFDDVLSGGHGGDVLYGNGGNDKFFGNNGDDLMRGGDGNDTFYASVSDGDDRIEGGNGFDVLDYSSLPGVVQVNQLLHTTSGTGGNDILLDDIEQIIGSAFDDSLSGSHGINSLNGGAGNDTIFGNRGDDNIVGGPGNDTIKLGPGNDVAAFRNGDGVDTILDFVAGGTDDSIRLKNYSGIPTTFAGLQANGNIVQNGADTDIVLLNGDMIILQNVTAANLAQSDFVF